MLLDPTRSQHLLQRTLREWEQAQTDLWLFAYGSLIWRPDFEPAERRPARVAGFHRCLKMRSRTNRGTPAEPGLVLALVSGGSCRGLAYRVPRAQGAELLARLWLREMPNGVYEPRWLVCSTPAGQVRALAFTLPRSSPSWTGELTDAELLHILRHARGRYGTTLDYVERTVAGLQAVGIRDHALERILRLARHHGL